jgi:membrane-associated phospholipid phosphatase
LAVFVGAWVFSTLVCVAFIDRAAATWAHTALKGSPIFAPLTHLIDPLWPGSTLCLIATGATAFLTGWRPGEKARTLLAACVAVVVSVALKDQLKLVFGRTWPETWVANNPSWVANGVYGFHLFHGGEGWASFPSGHMTQIAAFATVLWFRIRPLRWIWAALVGLVAAGLFGTNYHFVGDIVAGTYLGIATAAGVLALTPTPHTTPVS